MNDKVKMANIALSPSYALEIGLELTRIRLSAGLAISIPDFGQQDPHRIASSVRIV